MSRRGRRKLLKRLKALQRELRSLRRGLDVLKELVIGTAVSVEASRREQAHS